MKGKNIRSRVITLAVAACLMPLVPAFGAQNHNAAAQQTQTQQRSRTYYGQIVKLKNGKYALMINTKTNQGYYLDDQKDAKKYAQKRVLITGTINRKTSTLHVIAIKPAR